VSIILKDNIGTQIVFDRHFKTTQGMVVGCHAYPVFRTQEGQIIAMPTIDPEKKTNIKNFH
jgi:hypothetical protein